MMKLFNTKVIPSQKQTSKRNKTGTCVSEVYLKTMKYPD